MPCAQFTQESLILVPFSRVTRNIPESELNSNYNSPYLPKDRKTPIIINIENVKLASEITTPINTPGKP